MKFKAEVHAIEARSTEARVTLTNVKAETAFQYGLPISLDIPLHNAKSYPIGRVVTIEVKPK